MIYALIFCCCLVICPILFMWANYCSDSHNSFQELLGVSFSKYFRQEVEEMSTSKFLLFVILSPILGVMTLSLGLFPKQSGVYLWVNPELKKYKRIESGIYAGPEYIWYKDSFFTYRRFFNRIGLVAIRRLGSYKWLHNILVTLPVGVTKPDLQTADQIKKLLPNNYWLAFHNLYERLHTGKIYYVPSALLLYMADSEHCGSKLKKALDETREKLEQEFPNGIKDNYQKLRVRTMSIVTMLFLSFSSYAQTHIEFTESHITTCDTANGQTYRNESSPIKWAVFEGEEVTLKVYPEQDSIFLCAPTGCLSFMGTNTVITGSSPSTNNVYQCYVFGNLETATIFEISYNQRRAVWAFCVTIDETQYSEGKLYRPFPPLRTIHSPSNGKAK